MPLLQKPRDPNYGVRRVRRKPGRRKMLHASPLVETVAYMDMQKVARGRVIDDAIKLYRERRHELRESSEILGKRQPIGTSIAPDTLAYFEYLRSAITPGELIDAAMRLHRQVHEK